MGWEILLTEDDYSLYRENISLLEEQLYHHFPQAYTAPEITSAIRRVPRHFFVHPAYKQLAYTDRALPTANGLTTSAPSVIAQMIFYSEARGEENVLEIGTGTGYEAAVLAEMGSSVSTIEVDSYVAKTANRVLTELGYKIDKTVKNENKKKKMIRRYNTVRGTFPHRGTIELYTGNGQNGLPGEALFKAIIVAASVSYLQYIRHMTAQLTANNGRMVVPVGRRGDQTLHIIEKKKKTLTLRSVEGMSFDFVRLVHSE